MSSDQKTLQESLKNQGGLSGSSPHRSDGSRGREAGRMDCVRGGQRCSKKVGKGLQVTKGLLKTGKVTAQ